MACLLCLSDLAQALHVNDAIQLLHPALPSFITSVSTRDLRKSLPTHDAVIDDLTPVSSDSQLEFLARPNSEADDMSYAAAAAPHGKEQEQSLEEVS